jgi:3-keto-disaccharide hydrolase
LSAGAALLERILQSGIRKRKIPPAFSFSSYSNLGREVAMNRKFAMTMGLVAGFGVAGLSNDAAGQASGMAALTDGKNMTNFDKVGDADWRIGEGSIVANHGRGFLVTKQSYDNFRLRAEFYPDDETDSGIFIRCEDPKSPSAQSCYEINIYDTNTNPNNVTGSIINVVKAERSPQTELKWNVLEIEAKGPQLNVSINGERTASVRDTKHSRGPIALQYAKGVIYFRKVEIEPLSAADIEADAQPIYTNCRDGFVVLFPSEPVSRDIRYTAPNGTSLPAREYSVERGGNRYSVTVVDYSTGPKADPQIVNQVLADLSKRGDVRTRANVEIGIGKPGGQLNIVQPNGRQLRASAYMAQHRLYITQADAAMGDSQALQFEQSIAMVNRAGTDLDRVSPNNTEIRKYDCR